MGALTSKPYAFTARPWEIKVVPSVDFLDGEGASLNLHVVANRVVRVLPRINYSLNLEWISDSSRFGYDALAHFRAGRPRVTALGRPARDDSWQSVLGEVAGRLAASAAPAEIPRPVIWVLDPLQSLDALGALEEVGGQLGSSNFLAPWDGQSQDVDLATHFALSDSYEGLEGARLVFFLGTNLGVEAPTLGIRLRKLFQGGSARGFSFGPAAGLDPSPSFGLGGREFLASFEGLTLFARLVQTRARTSLLVGSTFRKNCSPSLLALFFSDLLARTRTVVVNFLQPSITKLNSYYLGLFRGVAEHVRRPVRFACAYSLGEVPGVFSRANYDFLFLQTVHLGLFSVGRRPTDYTVPVPAFAETAASSLNGELRRQTTRVAVTPPDIDARPAAAILRALGALVPPVSAGASAPEQLPAEGAYEPGPFTRRFQLAGFRLGRFFNGCAGLVREVNSFLAASSNLNLAAAAFRRERLSILR